MVPEEEEEEDKGESIIDLKQQISLW